MLKIVRIIQSIKNITMKIVKIIQKNLVTITLILIYYVGFGVTKLFVLLLNRRLLWKKKSGKESFWVESSGYNPMIEDCKRQS